ncbi:MAG TPA: magnesium transporter CorA family protein [Acidimicrobiales bacterium]
MKGTLTQGETSVAATDASVAHAVSTEEYFWLDLDAAAAGTGDRPTMHPHLSGGDPAIADLLEHTFGLHPLAVDIADRFGQRPKLEDYDDVTYIVAYGALASRTVEVHVIVSSTYVITVHQEPCPMIDEVRARLGRHPASGVVAPQILLVYLIIDALTNSFFPLLSAFDDRVDELEDAILQRPTEEQLGTLFEMKRQLLTVRKVVTPQRDMFASLSSGVTTLPGMTSGAGPYFRDLYDHLIRISDLVDNYRDLLSGVMDTHLSTVSNRLNVVMKQLTVIATVFLPLSFLTGFFGQNFAWLVRGLQSPGVFYGLGIGLEVVVVIVLMVFFKRRGWLGGPSA